MQKGHVRANARRAGVHGIQSMTYSRILGGRSRNKDGSMTKWNEKWIFSHNMERKLINGMQWWHRFRDTSSDAGQSWTKWVKNELVYLFSMRICEYVLDMSIREDRLDRLPYRQSCSGQKPIKPEQAGLRLNLWFLFPLFLLSTSMTSRVLKGKTRQLVQFIDKRVLVISKPPGVLSQLKGGSSGEDATVCLIPRMLFFGVTLF